MDLISLDAELRGYEDDDSLDDETNLAGRARAIDFVGLLQEVARARRDEPSRRLAARGLDLSCRLEERSRVVVEGFAAALRDGLRGAALRRELDRFTRYRPGDAGPHLGYDSLDVLLDGVFRAEPWSDASDALPPEFVHYETTPARVILELVDRVSLDPEGAFYDVGAGDGRVALLAHLLRGVPATGIEVQAGLCADARRNAERLRVTNARFLHLDARAADYAEATALYLFTPFRGGVLDVVLQRIHDTGTRADVLATFGPITRALERVPWLRCADPATRHDFRLAVWTIQDPHSRIEEVELDDHEVMGRIDQLVAEEHQLLEESDRAALDPTRRERLDQVQTALDRCWDLLRQRRARREFQEDPDRATPRSTETVEKYLQ